MWVGVCDQPPRRQRSDDAGGATLRKTGRDLNALNLSSELGWEFPLAPGEKKQIQFNPTWRIRTFEIDNVLGIKRSI